MGLIVLCPCPCHPFLLAVHHGHAHHHAPGLPTHPCLPHTEKEALKCVGNLQASITLRVYDDE